jgi:hypothetical protein
MMNRERVPTEQLQKALERALSHHFGKKTYLVSLRRRHSRYSSSSAIENVELELAGGKRLSLIFKDLSPGSLLESARSVRPNFLYDPTREIEIYRKVLDPAQFGTPIFYGAVGRADLKKYWLFLERVPGPLLWQLGRMETWRQAARWLARFHSHFAQAGYCRGKNQLAPLLEYDRRLLTLWWTRAETFLAGATPQGLAAGRGTLRSFSRLAGRHERVIDRLLTLGETFVHGEFYPSNVILRREGTASRVCPIDWEVAGIGPGLIDLAALTSGAWNLEQKKTMIAAYRDALEPARGWPPSLAELMEGVQYCQLHLAIQWLGWAADWSPPKMHARDWLREAVSLSTTLGI